MNLTQLAPATHTFGDYFPYSCAYANPICGGRTYYNLLRHVNTKIILFEDTVRNGRPLKRVVVEVGYKHPVTKETGTMWYGIIFDHQAHWICVGFQMISPNRLDILPLREDVYEYDYSTGEYPHLKSINCFRAESGRNDLFKMLGGVVTQFVRLDSEIPDSEFTLTSLGLPEPEGMTEHDPRLSDSSINDVTLFPRAHASKVA